MKMSSMKKSLMTLCVTMVVVVSIVIGVIAMISISSMLNLAVMEYKRRSERNHPKYALRG